MSFSHRAEQKQSPPNTKVIRSAFHSEREHDDDEDEYGENETMPDLEKDDMMARRTGSTHKPSVPVNQFLPVPGSVKYNISPVSGMKQLHSKPKSIDRLEKSDR